MPLEGSGEEESSRMDVGDGTGVSAFSGGDGGDGGSEVVVCVAETNAMISETTRGCANIAIVETSAGMPVKRYGAPYLRAIASDRRQCDLNCDEKLKHHKE